MWELDDQSDSISEDFIAEKFLLRRSRETSSATIHSRSALTEFSALYLLLKKNHFQKLLQGDNPTRDWGQPNRTTKVLGYNRCGDTVKDYLKFEFFCDTWSYLIFFRRQDNNTAGHLTLVLGLCSDTHYTLIIPKVPGDVWWHLVLLWKELMETEMIPKVSKDTRDEVGRTELMKNDSIYSDALCTELYWTSDSKHPDVFWEEEVDVS